MKAIEEMRLSLGQDWKNILMETFKVIFGVNHPSHELYSPSDF